jgi:hypothetical protein
MMKLRVMAPLLVTLCAVAVSYAGAPQSGNARPRPPISPAHRGRDLTAVRVALSGSGIFTPFRPVRVGRWNCNIPRGGLAKAGADLIHGVCETPVIGRAGGWLALLSESWNARDFVGHGGRSFREPGLRRRLTTSWVLAISSSGTIRRATISGDFPPQLVM